jgi:hypothetical protein
VTEDSYLAVTVTSIWIARGISVGIIGTVDIGISGRVEIERIIV